MSNKEIKLDTVPLLRSVVYSHQENCSVVTTRKKWGGGGKFTYGKLYHV